MLSSAYLQGVPRQGLRERSGEAGCFPPARLSCHRVSALHLIYVVVPLFKLGKGVGLLNNDVFSVVD